MLSVNNYQMGKIAKKAVCRSVFLTQTAFLAILPTG